MCLNLALRRNPWARFVLKIAHMVLWCNGQHTTFTRLRHGFDSRQDYMSLRALIKKLAFALIVQWLAPKTLNLLTWVRVPVRAQLFPYSNSTQIKFMKPCGNSNILRYRLVVRIEDFHSFGRGSIPRIGIRVVRTHKKLTKWQPGRVVKAADQKSADKLSRRFESCGCRTKSFPPLLLKKWHRQPGRVVKARPC